MTILITGAAGMVGRYFEKLAATFDQPLAFHDLDLDITHLDALRRHWEVNRYTGVVNLAAATDVDRCETEPEWAFRLNAVGAWNLALCARENDAEMVQVSTTMVLGGDGRTGPFNEMEPPNPYNMYARTKLSGEQYVERILSRYYIVRTCWVMGGGKGVDKKFVGKVRDKLAANEPIKAVNDQYGSPTYARDLVVCIRELLKTRAYGLYHATNQGRATRFDMASEMKRILGSTSPIEPVPASAFPLPAHRTADDTSTSYALPSRGLGEIMPRWQDALARYLGEWQG